MNRKFASLQEEVMFELSQLALGSLALFNPDLYRMGKEPCDIAWIANKCAILINCTSGIRSHRKKTRHNIGQFERWLKVWKNGEPLKGTVHNQPVIFQFSEIDHIFCLSIIEGGESLCQYHMDFVQRMQRFNVAVCATLTGDIIRELAQMRASPRDLLFWTEKLRTYSNNITDPKLLLNDIRITTAMEDSSHFIEFQEIRVDKRYTAITDNLISYLPLHDLREISDRVDAATVGIDLRKTDFSWFSHAYAALESALAAPGERGVTKIAVYRQEGPYTLVCHLACNSTFLAQDNEDLLAMKGPGVQLWVAAPRTTPYPTAMMAVEVNPGISMLEIEFATAREKSVAAKKSVRRSSNPD